MDVIVTEPVMVPVAPVANVKFNLVAPVGPRVKTSPVETLNVFVTVMVLPAVAAASEQVPLTVKLFNEMAGTLVMLAD